MNYKQAHLLTCPSRLSSGWKLPVKLQEQNCTLCFNCCNPNIHVIAQLTNLQIDGTLNVQGSITNYL